MPNFATALARFQATATHEHADPQINPACRSLLLHHMFVWWDPRQRARLGPACSYPRFSTHAMPAAFRIAADVYAQAQHAPPSVRHILIITNSQDTAVNNGATRKLLRRWQDYGALVREHTFRGEVGRLHDFIGRYQPGARPDLVYPLLFELVDQRA